MKLWSPAWANGEPIPEAYAAGRLAADGAVVMGDNLSPPLSWQALPEGTRTLVLLCHDFDVPSDRTQVNQPGRELAPEAEREEFFHWALVDIPPTLSGFEAGRWSRGFTARGKPGPEAGDGMRHAVNDYTAWFAGDAARGGTYFGYDGPFPPANDSLVHHVVFALFALDLPRLPVDGAFTGAQARAAMAGHVLGAATWSGTYTLNRRLRGA